jgi:hypothetical protein
MWRTTNHLDECHLEKNEFAVGEDFGGTPQHLELGTLDVDLEEKRSLRAACGYLIVEPDLRYCPSHWARCVTWHVAYRRRQLRDAVYRYVDLTSFAAGRGSNDLSGALVLDLPQMSLPLVERLDQNQLSAREGFIEVAGTRPDANIDDTPWGEPAAAVVGEHRRQRSPDPSRCPVHLNASVRQNFAHEGFEVSPEHTGRLPERRSATARQAPEAKRW